MDDDWRLTNQDSYLQGATWSRRSYRVWSDTWEHDHCEFCFAKFIDPDFSEAHAAMVRNDPSMQTEGYASLGIGPGNGDDYYWVCESCFGDFHDRFAWKIADAA